MRVHIYQLDDLSRLSWALLKTDSQVEAWCGRSVKIFGEGLYEGGWAGAASPFDPRALCFGSGFQTSSNRLVISTPSHTCEGIYTWTDGKRVAASNSLAFLFALCG